EPIPPRAPAPDRRTRRGCAAAGAARAARGRGSAPGLRRRRDRSRREKYAQAVEGHEAEDFSTPVLEGEAASDYERYLRTDELLALQKTPAEQAHRDELLFQTVHQASELWLKLAGTDEVEATRLIGAGDQGGAIRLLRRGIDCLKIVTGALDMLEHLSPWEY